MANDDAIGFSIDIPDKVFKDLDRVDDKISGLQKTADATAKAVSSSFKDMANGVNPFLEALKRANEDISKLGKSGTGDLSAGMNKTTEAANQMANSIVGVTTELNKFGTSGKNIAELSAEIKDINDQLRKGGGVELGEQQDIVDIRAKLKEELKLQEQSASEYLKNKQKEADAAERAAERKLKAEKKLYDELAKSYREQNQARNTTYQGSLDFSKTANTINREVTAIKYLTEARNNLSKTDANYESKLRTLNEAIKTHTKSIREATAGANEANKSHRNLMDTAGQLQRRLALVFSVSQVYGYVKNLVQVRAEFELQNRALAALLQNKDKADRLFAQITELAVKSPFTVKELVTYTKQLAAYQFESEKLYDTTKRLADVSAGLGVDMGRLILALGQVKAANYLRGAEVRQFTEAGFNILGELAKYYQELEGRMVSVAEVQERVTKRMVSFGDVETIFKRVTDAGGLFYNMQAIQAETLAGQISNLRDSIDIMFNEIGKQNDGALKDAVAAVRNLVENWETLVGVLKDVGVLFLAYKVSVASSSSALDKFIVKQGLASSASLKGATRLEKLNMAFKATELSAQKAGAAIGKFVASSGPMIALFLGLDVIFGIVKSFNDLSDAQAEVNKQFNASYATVSKISKAYNDASKQADGYKKKLTELRELNEFMEGKGYKISVPIELVTPENIDEVFADSSKLMKDATGFGRELGLVMAKSLSGAEGNIFGLSLLGENLKTDLEDLSAAYGEIGAGYASRTEALANSLASMYDQLTDKSKEYYDEIAKGQQANETEIEYQIRKTQLLRDIYTIQKNTNGAVKLSVDYFKESLDLVSKTNDIFKAEREVQYELDKVFDRLIDKYGSLDNLKAEYAKNPIVIQAEFDTVFERLQLDEQSRRFALYYASNKRQIPFEFVPAQTTMPQFTNDFKDTLRTLDTQGLFKNSMDSINTLLDLQNALIKAYKQNGEQLEVLDQANTKRLNLEGQIAEAKRKVAESSEDEQVAAQAVLDNLQKQKQTVDEQILSEKEKINAQNESIKLIAESFNLRYQEQKTAKSTTNIYKEQLSLIKQMGEAYKKYRQYYSEAESNELVRKEFSQAAQDAGIGNLVATMTFDASGIIAGLEEIGRNGGKAISKEVNKSIADIKTDANIEAKKIDVENVSKALDDLFAKYDFGKELEKLGIGKELGSQLFGIDAFNIDELSKSLDEYKKSIGDVGTEIEKQFTEAEKKVTEMQEKEYTERLKTYAEYLKKTISERAAAEIAAQQKIQEIQKSSLSEEQKQAATTAVTKAKDKQIATLDFEEFKKSDIYTQMFEDIDNLSTAALQRIKKNLDQIKESVGEAFSPEQLKTWQDAYNKIDENLIQRNPFASFKEAMQEVNRLQSEGKTEEALQEQLLIYDEQANTLKEQIADMEIILGMKQQGLDLSTLDADFLVRNMEYLDMTTEQLRNQVSLKQQSLGGVQQGIGVTNEDLNSYVKARKSLTAFSDELNSIKSLSKTAFGSIKDVLESIGVESDSLGMQLADMSMNILDLVLQAVMFDAQLKIMTVSAEAFGVALNTALGPIGWAVLALQAITSIFTSIAGAYDKSREKQIEAEKKKVERLQKAYENLQEVQKQSVNITGDYSALKAQQQNINAQIYSYERMIQLEQDKKKTDESKIKEWRDQIDDLRKEQAEIQKEFIQSYGGFGDNEAQKEAASEFIDVWYDAFKETGDGLDALKDKWAEYFDTILKKQMMMKVFDKYMNPVMDYIDKALEDGEVTVEEWEKAQELSEGASAKLNEFLKQMADQYGVNLTVDSDSLSGLSKGIQSITEETALALESLLNSIRFFVSDSNMQLKSILAAITSQDTMQNPILGELKAQTALIRSINDLFGSVVTSGDHRLGGKFLKVAF